MSSKNSVHVAVAVIQNSDGQYLIAKRPPETHQGGLWEFPGGKVEDNETVLEALKRELFEETGISFSQATPLIQIHHDYGDKVVFLDVFCIEDVSGEAFGKEGQEIFWIESFELDLYDFPAANLPIIKAVQLPDRYMITGEFKDELDLLSRIQSALHAGIKLIQFRAHDLSESAYFDYAKKLFALCETKNAKLLLNTSVVNYENYQAKDFSHGIHLTSKEINFFFSESRESNLLISTSIHNQEELLLAEEKKVDFVILSPVNKTLSHPESIPLGWDMFKELTKNSTVPVFALGGMTKDDLIISKTHGGQGIAAIGEFWGR